MYNGDALTVTFDEKAIGVIPDESALWAGRAFCLPDGSYLQFEMVIGTLVVSRNGEKLRQTEAYGSALGDASAVRLAGRLIRYIGGYTVAEGLIRIWFANGLSGTMVFSLLLGSAFVVLAHFVYKRSASALTAAVACYCLDTVSLILFLMRTTCLALGAIAVHIGLTVPLIMGLIAMGRLNRTISAGHG